MEVGGSRLKGYKSEGRQNAAQITFYQTACPNENRLCGLMIAVCQRRRGKCIRAKHGLVD